MNLFHFFMRALDEGVVYAHCDIPCGVYTTHRAAVAAETVEKMVEKILNPPKVDEGDIESVRAFHNSMTRFVATKEEWAQICKEELWILWSDYFKEEHVEKFPNLHDTFWKATKLCSQNKREVNAQVAKELREAVAAVSDLFEAAEADAAKTYRKEWL